MNPPPQGETPGAASLPHPAHVLGCCARYVRPSGTSGRAAREGGLDYGQLALISWLATAGFGGFLLFWWIGRLSRATATARMTHSRPPPYVPRLLVFLHV